MTFWKDFFPNILGLEQKFHLQLMKKEVSYLYVASK